MYAPDKTVDAAAALAADGRLSAMIRRSNSRVSRPVVRIRIEQLLDSTAEVIGQFKSEFEGEIVSISLDRVDHLSRDAHCFRELTLTESSRVTVCGKFVVHAYCHSVYP